VHVWCGTQFGGPLKGLEAYMGAAARVVVGARLWILRTLLKSLLNFKDRIEIPFEF
jgi:hypothetical protein